MSNKLFVWSCIVMTFFSACQQEVNEINEANGLRMSIAASIKGQTESVGSRYTGNDPTAVSFAKNDAIGVFINDDPVVKWTYDGQSNWDAGKIIYWPSKNTACKFYAFYPYDDELSYDSYKSVPMPSLLGQTGEIASISNCDFMVSSVSQSYETSDVVCFNGDNAFEHVSSLVQLTIKGNGDLSSSTLTKISISGNGIATSATYSFVTNKVTFSSDEPINELSSEMSVEMEGEDKTFYFIVNPKQATSGMVTLSIEYETEGVSYTAELEGFSGNAFSQGYRQSFTVVVKDSKLTLSGSSITPWEDGEPLGDIVINGTSSQS